MAKEVHQLAVSLQAEGAQETTEALEETQESFEEVTMTAEEESRELNRLAGKFKGFMTSIIAGLATAAAGILAQVPVLGEAAAAFSSVITQVALDIDTFLRPAVMKANGALFDLSERMSESDKQARAFRGGLLSVGAAASIVAGIGGVGAGVGILGLSTTLATLGPGFAVAAAGSALLFSELTGLTDVTGIAAQEFTGARAALFDLTAFMTGPFLAAIPFTAAVWSGNLDNIKQTAIGIFGSIVLGGARFLARLGGLWAEGVFGLVAIWDAGFNAMLNLTKTVLNRIAGFIEDTVNGIVQTVNQRFGTGFETISLGQLDVTPPEDIIGGALERFRQRRQRIRRGQRRLFTDTILSIGSPVPDRPIPADRTGGTGGARGSDLSAEQVQELIEQLRSGQQQVTLEVDGREVARAVKPFVGEGTRNRGRFAEGR